MTTHNDQKQSQYYQPLDSEYNRRFTINRQPRIAYIDWQLAEISEPVLTDWKGYLRVPVSGTYILKMTVDDSGYVKMALPPTLGVIEVETILEITGKHSSISTQTAPIVLDAGFYYIEMHHENSIPDRDYPNATQFKLELNGTRVDYLYDMVVPPNRLTSADAWRLAGCYDPVSYKLGPEAIWDMASEALKKDTGGGESCALRMSIALSNYGFDFKGIADNWSLKDPANTLLGQDANGNNKQYVLVGAAPMRDFLISKLGPPDYAKYGEGDGYTPRNGDVVVYADSGHTGLSIDGRADYGGGFRDNLWLLSRTTMDDPDTQYTID